jgi:hypothetical protein|tara:strand:+ start:1654 stop:2154 length:501 start_codon:yes stop_codon:yes gene_type:complete
MSNPFAPFAEQEQSMMAKAPQLTGLPMPNSDYQEKPGIAELLGPSVAQKGLDAAVGPDAQGLWAGLTAAPVAAIPAISGVQAAGMAQSAALTGGALAPGAAQAILGSSALAAPTVAAAAGTAGLAAAPAVAATAGGAMASLAPAALMAGPFAPLVLGAGMLAASGK